MAGWQDGVPISSHLNKQVSVQARDTRKGMEACCCLQSSDLGNTMSSTKVIMTGYHVPETGMPPQGLERPSMAQRQPNQCLHPERAAGSAASRRAPIAPHTSEFE